MSHDLQFMDTQSLAPIASARMTSLPDRTPDDGVVPTGTALQRLAEISTELSESQLADDARRLAERAAAGRFYVACVGQFKRGKSTLLDALLGRAALPADVVPVTAVPTIVRYGAAWGARVQFGNAAWRDIDLGELADYVTESHNPENVRGVTAVEVFAPRPLLASGMCFVDTPGLGSVYAGNTAATRAFIPHIDAALVVLGADPPISGEELALVEEVAAEVHHLLVVMNKADRMPDQDRATAAAFTRTVLGRRLGRPIGRIFEVSGLEQLEARGTPRDWPALVDALARLGREAGATLAQDAARRGKRRLARQLLGIVTMRRDALTRPLAESEARMAALARAASDAEQWLSDLGSVLGAEQRRLIADLETRRVAFVADARRITRPALARRLAEVDTRWGPQVRRQAMAAALEIARDAVTPWLADQQAVAAVAFAERTERFRGLTLAVAERIASMGVPEFSTFSLDTDSQELAGRTTFQFQALLNQVRPASPLRYAADVVLAAVGGPGAILVAAQRFLDWLLELNSSRVQADVEARLEESRARLERALRGRLRALDAGAWRAVDLAAELRASGHDAVQTELERLARLASELAAIVESAGDTEMAERGG